MVWIVDFIGYYFWKSMRESGIAPILFKIDFDDYNVGGQYLGFLLGPTVVALGVLFYEKYEQIKSNIILVTCME